MLLPISALIGALAACGVTYYLYQDVVASAAAIQDARDQLAAISARDTFARTAAQFLSETAAERSAVRFFIIPEDGTAQAIELVEGAAKLAGVKATVGSASLAPQGIHHERVDISVTSEGTFAGQARFATVLESLPRGATLTSTSLSVTEKGWYGAYTVSFVKQKQK